MFRYIAQKRIPLKKIIVFFIYLLLITFTRADLGLNFFPKIVNNPVKAQSAVTIKDTNYPIPTTNVFFVSSIGSDTLTCGALISPCKSISYTVKNRTINSSTVVIRDGTYREGVYNSTDALRIANKGITIQPYPHEKVIMKGSEIISDWVQDGLTWRKDNWVYQFKRCTDSTNATQDCRAVDFTNYPYAGYPDMVFLNNTGLTQVGTKSLVTTGKFYVDYTNKALYIGSNPVGNIVEASRYKNAFDFYYNTPGTIIRGIGIMHYSPDYQLGLDSAIIGNSSNITIENNTFAYNALQGLQVNGSNINIKGNLFLYNGANGVGVSGPGSTNYITPNYADNVYLDSNNISYNNQENFKTTWTAAATKLARIKNSFVRDNIIEYNKGKGVWCDVYCLNLTIVRNLIHDNDSHGIKYEISAKAIIASNLIYKNKGSGINVGSGGTDVKVYNNTVASNGIDIDITDDCRKVVSVAGTMPVVSGCEEIVSQALLGLGITADTKGTILKNNILSNTEPRDACINTSLPINCLINVRDFTNNNWGRLSAEQMISEMNNNAYFRSSVNLPINLFKWGEGAAPTSTNPNGEAINFFISLQGSDPTKNFKVFSTQKGKSFESNGIEYSGSINPFFVDESTGNYSLKSTSPGLNKGSALPVDIANVIGVSSGTSVNMGALIWPNMATPSNTPIPTFTSTVTPTIDPCPKKNTGDSNCDGLVNSYDFTDYFIKEYKGELLTKSSDYNKDTKVDLLDFEIWRENTNSF